MDTDDLLSPQEIEALMQAVESGELAPSVVRKATPQTASPYDFAAPGRIISSIEPTLAMINDRFASALRVSLFGMLQQHLELHAHGVQMMSLPDYLYSLPQPSSINVMRVSPLRGSAFLVFEAHLVSCIVDSFFGGGRRVVPPKSRASFTAAEQRIVSRLLEVVFKDLAQAWNAVMPLRFSLTSSESNPAYVDAADATDAEIMIVTVFDVRLEGGEGAFHLLLPYSMLEPLRARLTAPIRKGESSTDEAFSASLMSGLAGVDVTLTSTLARAEITLDELMRLAPGSVLRFEMPAEVTLDVEGVPIYRGVYGNVGDTRAVEVKGPAPR